MKGQHTQHDALNGTRVWIASLACAAVSGAAALLAIAVGTGEEGAQHPVALVASAPAARGPAPLSAAAAARATTDEATALQTAADRGDDHTTAPAADSTFASSDPSSRPALFDDTPAQPVPWASRIQLAGPTPQDLGKPPKRVVMIDPGHGGIDPGAIGAGKIIEKNVVLAVAQQLKASLESSARYTVMMTRTADVFVPLDNRVELSRKVQADIFISLHADTIDDRQLARAIRGASVYTLSERASDEEARRMAEKENAADLAGGIAPPDTVHADEVTPILFDLMARETAEHSRMLSRAVVHALGAVQPLAREPERAAAFRVLRQPHAPSILIELGFLSNAAEEHEMAQVGWQKKVAASIATAVDNYFAGKTGASGAQLAAPGGLPP